MKEKYKTNRENIKNVRAEIKKFKNERKDAKDKILYLSLGLFSLMNLYNIIDIYKKRKLKLKRIFICLTIPLIFNYYLQLQTYKYYKKKERDVIIKNFS